MKKPKPNSKKPKSPDDLSEEQVAVLLSCMELPNVIHRIAMCDEVYEMARRAPAWLKQWAKNMGVTPLFSLAEGDSIEGVAFVIEDLAAREFWLGVAGGLREIMDTPKLLKIPCVGDRLTASDIYPVWTKLLTYEHPDLMEDIFGSVFKVYDKKLLPQKHLQQFKKEVAKKQKGSGKSE